MKIENVRFSYNTLRPPTAEELANSPYKVTLRGTEAELFPIRVAVLVGYNPQRLLEYKPQATIHQWADEHASYTAIMGAVRAGKSDWIESFFPRDLFSNQEVIVCAKSPTARHIPSWLDPRVMPDDAATPTEDTRRWKVAVLDIVHAEQRVLSRLMDDPQIRGIILDIDSYSGEINHQLDLYREAAFYEALKGKKPEAVDRKPPPDYMRHDPTKSHKRRRRR